MSNKPKKKSTLEDLKAIILKSRRPEKFYEYDENNPAHKDLRLLTDPDLVVVPMKKLLEWDIGYNNEGLEFLTAVGLSRESLVEEIIAHTTGYDDAKDFEWELQGCDNIVIKPCIQIGKKLIPLSDSEFTPLRVIVGAPQDMQVEIFMRLLATRKITWKDIEEAELYPDVYNKLLENKEKGFNRQKKILKELDHYCKLCDARRDKLFGKTKEDLEKLNNE